MVDFKTESNIDFGFIMLGSLFVTNTADINNHFESVAGALNKWGLYLLDWCIQFEPPWQTKSDCWHMERDGIKVKTTVTWKPISLTRQIFEETIILEVDDRGKKIVVSGTNIHRAIYPQ